MLKYRSGSTGEEIELSSGDIRAHIKTAGLYDYEWEVSETAAKLGSIVSGFGKKAKKYDITLDFKGNKSERADAAEIFHRITETDVINQTIGRLTLNGYYIECYIIASEFENSGMPRTVRNQASAYAPYPFWIAENTYTFHSYGVSSSNNKRYTGKYAYRYANGMNNTYIQNPHFTDANFSLVIYGLVTNPMVSIGGQNYLVNIALEEGERLEIDSRTETVTKVMANGERVNAFHNREKGKAFFRKIPPGRQPVTWTGKFDWDLTIYEERSGPKWNR